MSTQITTAFVQQYRNNVQHLSQQKGSRLRMAVRNETQVGKSEFFDQMSATAAVKKTSRHSPTPRMDSIHNRRRVTLNDYEWADLIDKQDKVRMLIDPTSEYAQAAAWALGRSMDDEVIAAAIGVAYTDETGSTSTNLANANRIAACSTTTNTNLNINALIQAKFLLDQADVDPDEERYIAVNASAIAALLGTTQITSSDYNSVKALVEGKIDTFMGFKFIRIERLLATATALNFTTTTGLGAGSGNAVTLASTVKSCFAWAKSGLLLSSGMEINGRIDERSDMSYATQVYASGTFGATRMEENKVVEIVCNQA
jgi:hypothetical protein